jgi:membrane-bound ClpP family serine protease
MQFEWRKLLFRLVGLDFLSQEAGKFISRLKEELRANLIHWMLKGSLWLFLFLLFNLAFIFGLVALGLYLNEVLYSNYQGFLIVAGICLGLMLLLLGIIKLFGSKKKDQ